MNKSLVLGIVGAITVTVLAVWLILFRGPVDQEATDDRGNTAADTMNDDNTIEVDREVSTGNASLADLLARADNLECTIEYQADEATPPITGTYFTADGRVRGDFLVSELGPEAVSSMIVRDNQLYAWTVVDGQSYGMKTDLASATGSLTAGADEGVTDSPRTPVPLDESVTYRCERWLSVDTSVFEPPQDVLFRDQAALLNAGMEYGTIYEEAAVPAATSPCELCDQVAPGPGQDECRANFQCE